MNAYDALLVTPDAPQSLDGLECQAPSVIPSWLLELEQQRALRLRLLRPDRPARPPGG